MYPIVSCSHFVTYWHATLVNKLINKFNKVVGQKISKQNSVVFPYTNKEQFEKEIKKTIPLMIASKKNKMLRNKLK